MSFNYVQANWALSCLKIIIYKLFVYNNIFLIDMYK